MNLNVDALSDLSLEAGEVLLDNLHGEGDLLIRVGYGLMLPDVAFFLLSLRGDSRDEKVRESERSQSL